jgi:hypothetical protein
MSTDPSRYVRDLEPGQRVLIKMGTFGGMQGVVTESRRAGDEREPTIEVRVELRIRHRPDCPVPVCSPTQPWTNWSGFSPFRAAPLKLTGVALPPVLEPRAAGVPVPLLQAPT